MFTRSLKVAALAAAVVIATAGASFASQYAWVDNDANVRNGHYSGAPVINSVYEGQKVKIIGQSGNWFKIKIPGQDGWVKGNVLDFGGYSDSDWNPGYGGGYGFGGSACVDGKNVSFCIGY